MLTPGTYKLSQDVTNPNPDRRCKVERITSWRSWVRWPSGMIFVVEPHPERPEQIRLYARGGYAIDALVIEDRGFGAVAQALVPVVESGRDLLIRRQQSRAGAYALLVLDRLGVNPQVVDYLLNEIEAEEDEA